MNHPDFRWFIKKPSDSCLSRYKLSNANRRFFFAYYGSFLQISFDFTLPVMFDFSEVVFLLGTWELQTLSLSEAENKKAVVKE